MTPFLKTLARPSVLLPCCLLATMLLSFGAVTTSPAYSADDALAQCSCTDCDCTDCPNDCATKAELLANNERYLASYTTKAKTRATAAKAKTMKVAKAKKTRKTGGDGSSCSGASGCSGNSSGEYGSHRSAKRPMLLRRVFGGRARGGCAGGSCGG